MDINLTKEYMGRFCSIVDRVYVWRTKAHQVRSSRGILAQALFTVVQLISYLLTVLRLLMSVGFGILGLLNTFQNLSAACWIYCLLLRQRFSGVFIKSVRYCFQLVTFIISSVVLSINILDSKVNPINEHYHKITDYRQKNTQQKKQHSVHMVLHLLNLFFSILQLELYQGAPFYRGQCAKLMLQGLESQSYCKKENQTSKFNSR